MRETTAVIRDELDPVKFRDPEITAAGAARASVRLRRLETLWFNTGTPCNLTCANCYIESSPGNDRLAYLSAEEVRTYLDEIAALGLATREIAFTGGEPFMNPEILAMFEAALGAGFQVLVLTNAMRPMMKCAAGLAELRHRFGDRLTVRVSLDHYSRPLHDLLRGKESWNKSMAGLRWLAATGIRVHVAGRTCWSESVDALRQGYKRMLAEAGIPVDAGDPAQLVLFPEMDEAQDVPEITEACWSLLDVEPAAMMCATSRMVVKRKDAAKPIVLPCTLLPYDRYFELGRTLATADRTVKLNHPHCARFCVLGGGSCSRAE